MRINHFGVLILDKPTNHISKDVLVNSKIDKHLQWTDEQITLIRKQIDFNFDLNMMYMSQLNDDEFNACLDRAVTHFGFTQCTKLNCLDKVAGVYVLVLDKYKQVYVGQSIDIKKRILSHWNKSKTLDRMIFGNVVNSILSVDFFGALDTTRIFYLETDGWGSLESLVVNFFDPRFIINRTAGSIGSVESDTDTELSANLAVSAGLRRRNMVDFVDPDRLVDVIWKADRKWYSKWYPELKGKLRESEE